MFVRQRGGGGGGEKGEMRKGPFFSFVSPSLSRSRPLALEETPQKERKNSDSSLTATGVAVGSPTWYDSSALYLCGCSLSALE